MPTQIADIIVPAEFTAYIVENSLVSSALFQSGVAVPNLPRFGGVCNFHCGWLTISRGLSDHFRRSEELGGHSAEAMDCSSCGIESDIWGARRYAISASTVLLR